MKMQQTLDEQVREVARHEIIRGGHKGIESIKEFNRKPHFKASTLLKTGKINLKFNPEYEEKNPGKTVRIIKDLMKHEIDHHKYKGFHGCPRSLDEHVKLIYEPISDVLSPEGFNKKDCHYVANALEDSILHKDLSREFSLEGIAYFFKNIGDSQKTKKFSQFYEAHVKLNMYLFGKKQQKRQLKKYYMNPNEVKDVLVNFLEKSGISSMEIEGIKDRVAIRQYLNNEQNWPKIAKAYAEEFSKLMTPGYAMPLPNHSGKGTSGYSEEDEDSDEDEEGGFDSGNPEDIEGNEFDKEMHTKRFKMKRINEANANNEGIPSWIDKFEAMDLLYTSLGQKLVVKAESFTEQSTMPIYWYGKRELDPERDNLKHVKFGFGDDGKLQLQKKRWHLDMPIEYKKSPKGFPEARWILLDTSGSMAEGFNKSDDTGNKNIIPWGDRSKYHGALVEWYGFQEYLKQNYLLQQTNISLVNFSKKTYMKKGLMDAKRLALDPQFGSTKLDLDKINDMFEGRENMIFTLSDGAIDNWNSIKEEFMRKAKQHYYFHLQLGKPNTMTKDLEKNNIYVEYINSADELHGRTVDLTDKLYRGRV